MKIVQHSLRDRFFCQKILNILGRLERSINKTVISLQSDGFPNEVRYFSFIIIIFLKQKDGKDVLKAGTSCFEEIKFCHF